MISTYYFVDTDEVRTFGATSNDYEFLLVVDAIVTTADEVEADDIDVDLLDRAVDALRIAHADFEMYGNEDEFFLDGYCATAVAAGVWAAMKTERDALSGADTMDLAVAA